MRTNTRPTLRSPLSTRLYQHIRRQEFVQAGDGVAVAVSGGADSVALLQLLLELREKLGVVLSVAHFNHQLRRPASDADERFVAKLAAQHGLDFHVARADVGAKAARSKANLEDTARRERYAFFDRLVAAGHATRIAVAHTADDQAETVLAHILRGTGLAGLGGIHPIADHVFRPLLQFRRAELRAYLDARQQAWREDASNRDTTRTRARIRKKLIPLLEKDFQPAVVEHLANLAELAREDEAYLESQAERHARILVQQAETGSSIKISDLLHRHMNNLTEPRPVALKLESRARSKRLIRRIIQHLKRRDGQLNARHVQSVLDLAERGENGKLLPLPGGIEVRRENDALTFRARSDSQALGKGGNSSKEFAYNVDLPADADAAETVLPVPCLGRRFRLSVIDWPAQRRETSETRSVLDRDALRQPLVLRSWRPGDTFRPGGHRKAHKLKRLLNRQRVSRWDRGGWPVLTSGGVLVWARGFPVAAEFAASERTRVGILIAEDTLS